VLLQVTAKKLGFPVYQGRNRPLVGKSRPVSLAVMVCKQMEHVIAEYLRQVWEMSGWLYDVQHALDQGTHVKIS
jgi:hypothetical protein